MASAPAACSKLADGRSQLNGPRKAQRRSSENKARAGDRALSAAPRRRMRVVEPRLYRPKIEDFEDPTQESGLLLEGRFRIRELLVTDGTVALYLAVNEGRRYTPPHAQVFGILISTVPEELGPWHRGSTPRYLTAHPSYYRREEALFDTLVSEEIAGPAERRGLWYIAGGKRWVGDLIYSVHAIVVRDLRPPSRSGKEFLKQMRLAVLEADGYKCRRCGSTEKLQVDHIVPVFRGGDRSFENGQTLCRGCHLEKTSRDSFVGGRVGLPRRFKSPSETKVRRLKAERSGAGVTQSALSAASGVPIGRISALERGLRTTWKRDIISLARALWIEPRDLIKRPQG